jgi:5-methyltetrahydropteroyltriglutamate--homocysteine methyltransferase
MNYKEIVANENCYYRYPRIGKKRELKFRTEDYIKENLTADALESGAKELRRVHWNCIARKGIDFIPSNDFSFYDNMLDTACLFNIIPQRYKDLKSSDLSTYFAMARGYQAKDSDAKALPMKKWFNTNYHYIVPEFEDSTEVKLSGEKPFT